MNSCRHLILLFLTVISIDGLQAQAHSNIVNGLAIEGYDPVAYFASGQAIGGKKEISVKVGDVTYRFAKVSNKDFFQKNPQNYQPQYGGWCAYAMGANGEKVEVDPGNV